jgi:hypothetical protein
VVPITASITKMFHYEAFEVPGFKMLHTAKSSIVTEITYVWSQYGTTFFRVPVSYIEIRNYK